MSRIAEILNIAKNLPLESKRIEQITIILGRTEIIPHSHEDLSIINRDEINSGRRYLHHKVKIK